MLAEIWTSTHTVKRKHWVLESKAGAEPGRAEPSRAEPGAAAGDNPAAHLARPLQVLETLWQTSKWWISGGNRDYPLTQKVKITVGGTTREFN